MDMSTEEKIRIYKQLSEISSSLARVLLILESDSRTNTPGIVETVKANDRRITELEVQNRIRKSQMTIYGSLGAAIVGAIYFLFKQVVIFLMS